MAIDNLNNIYRNNDVSLKSLQNYIDRFISRNRKTVSAELQADPTASAVMAAGRTNESNLPAQQLPVSGTRGLRINILV